MSDFPVFLDEIKLFWFQKLHLIQSREIMRQYNQIVVHKSFIDENSGALAVHSWIFGGNAIDLIGHWVDLIRQCNMVSRKFSSTYILWIF